MCELISIAAAAFFAVLFFRSGWRDKAAATAMFMFLGASLMWGVDCVANAMDGEPLLDMSREDAVLGAIVLAAGLAVWGAESCIRRLANAKADHNSGQR